MNIAEITPSSPLRYGDDVKIKNKNSKYANLVGKIVDINNISANVQFKGMKRPVVIILDALERI